MGLGNTRAENQLPQQRRAGERGHAGQRRWEVCWRVRYRYAAGRWPCRRCRPRQAREMLPSICGTKLRRCLCAWAGSGCVSAARSNIGSLDSSAFSVSRSSAQLSALCGTVPPHCPSGVRLAEPFPCAHAAFPCTGTPNVTLSSICKHSHQLATQFSRACPVSHPVSVPYPSLQFEKAPPR